MFAFFVVWILHWVALSGWLLAVLGFAPTLIGLGVSLENQTLINWGTNVGTANGIVVVSILNALVSLVLLVCGFRNYVRFQYVMWYAILASFGLMLLLFFTTNPTDATGKLNDSRSRPVGRPTSSRRRRPPPPMPA